MIEIRTTFNPFKMKIARREPVSLSVELINKGRETEIVSFELGLGKQFSLEGAGFKTTAAGKIPELLPGESKKFYFDIWAKQMLRKGEQDIALTVIEHYQGFNYIKKKYEKVLRLAVEE